MPSAILVGHEGANMQTPDNSCSRSASTSTNAITLMGTTIDSAGAGVGPTTVSIFYTAGFSGTPDVTTTTDGAGLYSTSLVTPEPNEFDVLLQRTGAYDVHFENSHIFFSSTSTKIYPSIDRTAWSAGLLAIGETANAAQGAILATATDCDDRFLEYAVVTLSSTSSRTSNAAPTFVAGTRVYYLDGTPPAPVRRSARTETSPAGAFVIVGLQPGTVYVQSWGFPTANDLAMGMAGLKIVGEKQLTITADVLTSTQLTPRSGP